MNYVVNATKGSLPRFYIFMGETIKDEYIKHCKARTCMGRKGKHGWLFFIQRVFIIIQEVNSKWHHKMQLTTINSRWTWVTCYTKNNQTSARSWIGHDYIIISHFSCLITLDENCFKPFKKERDNAMVKNNHYKPNKWTFVTWVDKSLDQSLSRKNVNNGFRGIRIWPWMARSNQMECIQLRTFQMKTMRVLME